MTKTSKTNSKPSTLTGSGIKPVEGSSYTVGTLDDKEFEQSFSLERDTPQDTGIDRELIGLLARQKRFHALSKELQKFDDEFDGRADLEKKTQSALNQAMTLFQEANELEHQGKQQETLAKLQAIEELVSDDPLVGKAKRRVQQAFDLLSDWVSDTKNETPPPSPGPSASPKTFIEDTTAGNQTKKILVLGGSALVLFSLLLTVYFFFDSSLKKATSRYAECQQLLDTHDFRAAEQKCEEALELIADIYVFKQDKKKQLTEKIRTLLDSPTLRQGLTGKTLVDGRYVTQADKELLLEFTKTMKKGDSFFADERWEEANHNYNQALMLTKRTSSNDPATLAELHQNIARTKIYLAIEKGKEAFAASQWDTAISQYGKATKLLAENASQLKGINVESTSEKLARLMLRAEIIRDRQNAEKYIQAKQYGRAVKRLKTITQVITDSQFADHSEFRTILQEILSQLDDAERQLVIDNQANYLRDNYKNLFLKHYPSATRSNLINPRVNYLGKKGNKLLFRIQCTETTGGRPLRLQMDYLFSPSDGSWRFYTEE
ncbi:MAG: hypothetical protein K9K37_12630 [Desulfocapsa sp.]|nr:hypothetical protein [Desulfocapsa sp.]